MFILLIPPSALASSGKWISTPLRETVTPQGLFQARAFERLVVTPQGAYPIGQVTLLRFPSKAFDPDFVAADLGRPLGIASWRTRSSGRARVFEASWPGTGRFVRLHLDHDPRAGQATVSVAMFREAYFSSAVFESERIQRSFDRPAPRSARRGTPAGRLLQAALARIGVALPGAVAEDCPDHCNPNDIGCLLQQLLCGQDDMTDGINGLGDEIGGLSGEVGGLSGQLDKLDKTIGDNWAETNRIGNELLADAQAGLQLASEFSEMVEQMGGDALKLGNDFLREYRRTNDLIEKFIDPTHAFQWAAASAAGAVAGTFIVNAALDAVITGGAELLELMKGAKRERDIYPLLEELRARFLDTRSDTAALLARIDGLLGLEKIQSQLGISREDLVLNAQQLSGLKDDLSREMRNLQRRSDAAYDTDRACSDRLHETYKGVKAIYEVVESYEGIRGTIRKAEGLDLCAQLGEIARTLVKAELDLARLADTFEIEGSELFKKVRHDLALEGESSRKASRPRAQKKTRRVALAVVDYVWDAYYRDLKTYARPYVNECMLDYVGQIPWETSIADPDRAAKMYQEFWYKCLDRYVETHPAEKRLQGQMVAMKAETEALIEKFFTLPEEEIERRHRRATELYLAMIQEEVRFLSGVGEFAGELRQRSEGLSERRQRINQTCGFSSSGPI